MRSAAADSPFTLFDDDLSHVLHGVGSHWELLRGARLFITGGTGFFGQWLVESFAYANERLALDASAVVLTRDPARARARRRIQPAGISYLAGDVRTFGAPHGRFDWCIHGAADATPKMTTEAPGEMIATIVDGTRRVLEFAASQPMQGVLLVSSGAVYGRQPADVPLLAEDHLGAPDATDPVQAYAESKRMAELLGAVGARRRGVPVKIARCFAFVGPYLPLDAHFAIGNFIRSRLTQSPIVLTGDGTPVRTYLYAADLAVWLWTILLRGLVGRAYNVGSERCISIHDLAGVVAAGSAPPGIAVQRRLEPASGRAPERYAPSTARARAELGLAERIGLADAIERTARWYETANAEGRAPAEASR